MRIGIDGRSLQNDIKGIGRYVFELCKHLDILLPNAKFFIYSKEPITMPSQSARWVSRVDPLPFSKHIKLWLMLRCGSLCKKDDLDLFWGCATFLPNLPRGIKTVSTVHDLNYKIVPDTVTFGTLWQSRLFFEKDVRRANIVVANSEGTSIRLHSLLGRKANAVIPPAITKSFRPQSGHAIKKCMQTHNIHGRYILAVATWEPRKNLETLISTFISMKNNGELPHHKLILAGSKGWKDKRLSSLVDKDNQSNILPLGYIADKDLPPLYSGADVFVFPSIYEGFGIPALEARACGTKVVTSDIPELHEAGGPDAIYNSPTREGIRKGILTALSQDLEHRTHETDYPTWERSAKTLADVFTGMLSER